MTDDLKNKAITFDFRCEDVTSGKTENLVLQLYIGGSYYKINNVVSSSNTGMTRETVVDANSISWYRITIDLIAFAASTSPVTNTTNIGFNLGYCTTIYIDNLYIGTAVTI